jgi:hypothetical protein
MDFLPIAEISPYRRNWVIQGRITDRTNIREFNRKDGGSGKVFKIDLVDLKSGDIQVNFWGEGADKFNYLQKGDVITLKGGSVKLANKRYNNTSSNYELHSESNTEVTKVDAAASKKFDAVSDFVNVAFKPISDLKDAATPCYSDLLVMVKSQEPAKEIKKGDKTLFLRNLIVADKSEHTINIALWDNKIEEESLVDNCLVMKAVGIKDYNSRSGNANIERVTVNPPNLPAAEQLKEWWESTGKTVNLTALSDNSGGSNSQTGVKAEKMEGSLRDLKDVTTNMVTAGRVVDYTTVAYLSGCRTVNKDGAMVALTYNACTTCRCKVQEGDYCVKCQKVTQSKPKYMLQGLSFEDHTYGKQWASSLEENACSTLMGKTPEETKALNGDISGMQEVTNRACFNQPYNLRLRVTMEEYQGDLKPKARVQEAVPVNKDMYAAAGQSALNNLASLYNGLPAETQESVKALLASLPTIAGGAAMQPAWQNEFTALRAVVA